MSKGVINVKPLISNKFKFEDSIKAIEFSSKAYTNCNSNCVKNMIVINN